MSYPDVPRLIPLGTSGWLAEVIQQNGPSSKSCTYDESFRKSPYQEEPIATMVILG